MTWISIGSISFNTDDFSEDLQAAIDLLLEEYLKEKIGRQVICISSDPTDKLSESFHPDHSFQNAPLVEVMRTSSDNNIEVHVPPNHLTYEEMKLWHETNRWYYNSLLKEMSDRLTLIIMTGHAIAIFHRRCFMQLKTFSNLRFQQ